VSVRKSRKVRMMELSYICVMTIAIIYLLVMAYLSKEPSATVLMSIFAALGLGHGSANWANAHEHKSKAGLNE